MVKFSRTLSVIINNVKDLEDLVVRLYYYNACTNQMKIEGVSRTNIWAINLESVRESG